MKSDRERLFFALWPDMQWQKQYYAALRRVLASSKGRWMPFQNLHITLAFMGAVKKETRNCLENAADSIIAPAFELRFTRLGYRPRNKMVWGVPAATPSPLLMLVDCLRESLTVCGLTAETRRFVPHITLLRNAAPVTTTDLTGVSLWAVNSFTLVRSTTLPEGAIYEKLREWPLQPPDRD